MTDVPDSPFIPALRFRGLTRFYDAVMAGFVAHDYPRADTNGPAKTSPQAGPNGPPGYRPLPGVRRVAVATGPRRANRAASIRRPWSVT